jgi:hypothetical protein
MELWEEYRANAMKKHGANGDEQFGLRWTQVHPFEDKYGMLPK